MSLFSIVVFISLFSTLSFSLRPKPFHAPAQELAYAPWSSATGTWYGDPLGAGSDGGACGYQSDVEKPPFSSMVSAVGPGLFNSGEGCGACYQVKCTLNGICSTNPVTVVVTDSCPGCTAEKVHFDMSGTAFGAMAAAPGRAAELRNAGSVPLQFQRVGCNYGGTSVAFHVDSGSNSNYFAAGVEYEGGDGDLAGVEIKQGGDLGWEQMQHSWGAVWKFNSNGGSLRAPFSLRLTTPDSKKTLEANNVIPLGWAPGTTYRALVNFPPLSSSSIHGIQPLNL